MHDSPFIISVFNFFHLVHTASYIPHSSVEDLFPGTWYLTRVDEKHRREYARKPLDHDLLAEPELVRSSTAAEVQHTHPCFLKLIIK